MKQKVVISAIAVLMLGVMLIAGLAIDGGMSVSAATYAEPMSNIFGSDASDGVTYRQILPWLLVAMLVGALVSVAVIMMRNRRK